MHETDLHLEPNEASDLTVINVANPGYDRTMLTVLDEAHAEDALALLIHQENCPLDEGWEARRVPTEPSTADDKTEDAEACATRDGYAYLLGSQFGKKTGPLSARRSWIARIPEHDLVHADKPTLEIARLRFGLHRAVNDALRGTALLPLGKLARERYIDATIKIGVKENKRWAGRVQPEDQPINVEAMEFTAEGSLLLGLRYPVTAEGHPLLVEILHPETLFEDPDALPEPGRVFHLQNIGSAAAPAGFRALDTRDGHSFDAVIGDLDAANKSATVLEDHPEGGEAASEHVRFTVAGEGAGLTAECVHHFGEIRRVEGVAIDHEGHSHFVIDEEGHVALRTLVVE
ncbi:hypothetical protein DVA67_008130 [Solirubrobacter sp. CPCC 204708]|uniref:Uncharacterized protein n=1 Tax=Solirubrobacter deserti TaxID=2282478 RepID=A0ABT4RUR9_9ACTN|nr:hypothetical protein [Solirubrobacter deserti]MBE2315939.1 hypothetical protein [Solirubrobacter deserti]MDA0142323.1 hypothetical protein [Solirubrobacter deserti]